MTFFELLTILHDGRQQEKVALLNNSKFVTSVRNLADYCFFDTGVTFEIHTGSKFELFFDLEQNLIVRQPVSKYHPLPNYAGLGRMDNGGNFLYEFCPQLLVYVRMDDQQFQMEKDPDVINQVVVEKKYKQSICFYREEGGDMIIVREFPATLCLEKPVYYGNDYFEESTPERRRNYADQPSNEDLSEEDDEGFYARPSASLEERELHSWDEDYPGWRQGRGE